MNAHPSAAYTKQPAQPAPAFRLPWRVTAAATALYSAVLHETEDADEARAKFDELARCWKGTRRQISLISPFGGMADWRQS
jgi:hypothetical protein